jgi:DNA-binding winged helix-turn-helix (wHTH) protein
MDDLRIGSWVVAPSLNSITSGGRTVRLEPKVMGVLLCLAASAELRVVTKDGCS